MNKKLWGKGDDGKDVYRLTITNSNGIKATVMNYGANLLELFVPDKEGNFDDVVLGFQDLSSYFVNNPGFGCSITPYANRIGNATFQFEGQTYSLEQNDGVNNLHSSTNPQPLHRRTWDIVNESIDSAEFSIHKKDMDMGFPGDMTISVKYTLLEDNTLAIEYRAVSDRNAVFNPTNHSYFNLAGFDAGSVLDEIAWIDADKFTPTDEGSIPYGDIVSVAGTPLDFRIAKSLGQDIEDTSCDAIRIASGYDHNFVLNNYNGTFRTIASLYDPESGRLMDVSTDMPGLQMYTGNYLTPDCGIGKKGVSFNKRFGVAFETQFYPNAVNIPSFPQPILKAGKEFYSKTSYHFSVNY
jgi:aldose 1-epimerase